MAAGTDEDREPLAVGQAAPDCDLRDHTDRSVRLSEYWSDSAVLLLFLRHFG